MAKSGKASQRKSTGAPAASSPELVQAWRQFEAGDVVSARRTAAGLLATGSLSDSDQASAEDLISRTQFPKWAFAFAAFAGGVIVLLIVLAITRS